MAVSFNSGGNPSTQRKQPTCGKSLKTLSHSCIDYIGSCQSYYHTIMTMMAPREKIYTRALIGVK
jgi:hypothetical protein